MMELMEDLVAVHHKPYHTYPALHREDIFKEIEILMKVDHPNVMYMKECFIASDKVRGKGNFVVLGQCLSTLPRMFLR